MISDIRLASQQLSKPDFDKPKDLVSWMGAIQAQNYNMAKWAIGVRLKTTTLQPIEQALRQGEILRIHIMRPTWHFVAAEDIRWMLKLSAQRIKSANESFSKGHDLDISESLYTRCNNLIEKILGGNKSLTRQEISEELDKAGLSTNIYLMTRFMARAEVEGIVCSGIDKGGKETYALLEERVPPTKELHREEALAKLAIKYFQSHSPASLNDFIWWSGLSITEAKQAIGSIESELIRDRFASHNLFVHQSGDKNTKQSGDILHLLPSFDEYLISYKERTTVMDLEHHPKAFNNYGIFYPVILYNGRIVGNWKKTIKKGEITIETSFFEKNLNISPKLIETAKSRHKEFYDC